MGRSAPTSAWRDAPLLRCTGAVAAVPGADVTVVVVDATFHASLATLSAFSGRLGSLVEGGSFALLPVSCEGELKLWGVP